MKLTDDVTQRKTKEQKTSNNNLTLPRANKAKKIFHRFLHRGKPIISSIGQNEPELGNETDLLREDSLNIHNLA